MSLEALKFLERRKIRIAVVQMYDKSHRHEIVAEMVDERAASGVVVERPAERVLHEARPVLVGRDLPELFEPDAEFLRLTVLAQAETLDQHLAQAAARTFGKQRIFAAQLHAARESRFVVTVFCDAHVAGSDAGDRAVFK